MAETGSGDGDGDGDGGACTDFGAKYGECNGAEYTEVGVMFCMDNIALGEECCGPECGMAQEAMYACVSTLPCEHLVSQVGCEAEWAVVDAVCG